MGKITLIEWTNASWNPITGCTKISSGCKNCYAESKALELQEIGSPKYKDGFEVATHPSALDLPTKWKDPLKIFVNSMSDVFHDEISDSFIRQIWAVMLRENRHTYMILTKRPERLVSMDSQLTWRPNIWMGVTVEDASTLFRLDLLRKTGAFIKFTSMEPLLGPMPAINLEGINWVIVGGESGPHARPMKASWVRDIRDQVKKADKAFFFKQWSTPDRWKNGKTLDGIVWHEFPK